MKIFLSSSLTVALSINLCLLSSCSSNSNTSSANNNSIGQAEYGEADKTDKNTAPGKPMEKKPSDNKNTAANTATKSSDANFQSETKESSNAKNSGTGR